MSDVKIITPPSRLYTNEYSFLLIYPSKIVKEQFQQLIHSIEFPIHIYLYEQEDKEQETEWLLDTFKQVNLVILDIDNCEPRIRDLTGYFLSRDKTYWLTKGDDRLYNVINKNRLYNLDFLENVIKQENNT